MINRSTKVLFPVFNGYEVRLILSRDVAATGRRLKEDLTDAHAAYITKDDKPGTGWLVLGPDHTPGIIAHEASHAIRDLFKFAGVGTDEEAFAYHLDFLVTRVHKFIERTNGN